MATARCRLRSVNISSCRSTRVREDDALKLLAAKAGGEEIAPELFTWNAVERGPRR